MSNKIRIIYVMDDTPPYELYRNSKRPEINWDLKNGSWVGIWGYDWGNRLGDYILRHDSEISFEIRQPDFRADRIYEHKFENNTVHKLFPANTQKEKNYIISELLVSDLCKQDNTKTIVHVGVPGRFSDGFINKIKVDSIIGTFHGEICLPLNNLFIIRKNIFNYGKTISEQNKFKKNINFFDIITYQSDFRLNSLKKYFSGKLEKVTMGTDYDMFRKIDKNQCRKELNLPENKKILLSVGRISNIKGQAEVITELIKLKDKYDFLYIVAGHGSKSEEDHILKLAQPLIEKSQILFPGYLRAEILVKYYNSADAFLMTSTSEAGPVTSMEAIACEVPVITTKTGNVSEYLKKEGAGIVVDKNNLTELGNAIKSILNGAEIKICDRNRSKALYDWNNIALKFIKIYRDSLNPGRI
jgi:glycosyltransferase involved in cell wall biosynthesis